MTESPKLARLRCDIPAERYSSESSVNPPPKAGDIVELDQGFTGPNGEPMVLAYTVAEAEDLEYWIKAFESELEP